MYDLQALTAEAQQRYEDALAKIEAASYGLTSEEETALNKMIGNFNTAIYWCWMHDDRIFFHHLITSVI